VVTVPVVPSNAAAAVKETDAATNSAAKSVTTDPRTPGFATASSAAKAAGPAEVGANRDDATSTGTLEVSESDAENGGEAPEADHEVEPVLEYGGGGETVHSEDEAGSLNEGGGEGGNTIEAGGASEAEPRLRSASFSEQDDEEYDDDQHPVKEGVDAKDIDKAGEAKVTTSEKNAPNEFRIAPNVDGNGNVDVKQLLVKGDKVDTLNKDLLSTASVTTTSSTTTSTSEDVNAAADPNAANRAANGEQGINAAPPSQRGVRSPPRPVPAVRPELALRKKGLAVLPTAPRRPFPASSRPDTALTFDWRGEFTGDNFVKIPHSSHMNSPTFTLTFYLTVKAGSSKAAWRNILHKGFTNFQRTPSVWLEYGSNKLYVAVSTTVSSDETLTSKTSLIEGIPAHIAYVVTGSTLQIWINGELDAEKKLLGKPLTNTGPLYIGKDPFYAGGAVTLHSFRWTERAMGGQEIRLTSTKGREVALLAFDRPGKFDGGSLSSLSVPHDQILASTSFTVCFWATLHSHSTGRPRAILHKGFQPNSQTPFIELDARLNRLNVRVSTTAGSEAEGFFSKGSLRVGQPTHVCYVRRDRELTLFLDGEVDTTVSTVGTTVHDLGPLFVGNSPFTNGFDGAITGFRWYGSAFTAKDISAVVRATAAAPLRIRTASRFAATDFIRVPHVPGVMDTPDFTVSMWIRPTSGPTGQWRSILHKGLNDLKRTPSLWFNPESNQVTAEVSTTYALKSTVRLTSKKVLAPGQLAHLALTLRGNEMCLIIEGWIDSCVTILGRVKSNRGTLMVGKSPRFPGFVGDISDLRYYPRALSRAEVSPYEMDIPEPVFSYWNPTLGDHVLSLNKRAFGVGLKGYQVITSGETVGVHGTGEGTPIGYAHNIVGKNLVPLYGYYNDRTGDHWYTTDASATRPGYVSDGPVMYVFPKDTTQDSTVVPVYEHFNAKLGDSFFTPDPSPGHGYESKGTAFFLHKDGSTAVPVFEFYNPPAEGGSTLEVVASVPFNGWTKMATSDLGFLTPSRDFAISLWLKLRSAGQGFYRTILHHGAFADERAPALYLQPHEPRLALRMSTGSNFNEGMDSRTELPINQFTHVVIVSHGSLLMLYINGELDAAHSFKGTRSFNPGPMHVGRFPDAPGVDGTVSNFQFFDHILSSDDVKRIMVGDTAVPELSLSYAAPLTAPIVVPDSLVFRSESFTALVEYTLTEGATGAERAIFWKGNNKDESAPSMVLMPDDNRVMVKLSTTTAGSATPFLISDTVLEVGKLYKIALIRDGNTASLFINHRLDKTVETTGAVLFNNGALYLNKAPWTGAHTGTLSSFKWFGRAMSLREVEQFSDLVERRSVVKQDWRGRLGFSSHISIPDTPAMDVTKDFTWSFWVNLDFDTTGPKGANGFNGPANLWRQIALKGEQHFAKSPQISIYPATGRVRVMVHKEGNVGEFEHIDSTNTIPTYTPTHIALVRAGAHLRLFINGVEENQMLANGMINSPNMPLALGNLNVHVSNFRWMNFALMDADIINEVYSVSH